jgi:hypothetical protein
MTSVSIPATDDPFPGPEVSPWTTHADEVALLFLCARTTIEGREEELRRLLGRDLDWTFLLRQAARHGVDPMLYHHLAGSDHTAVPSDAWKALRTRGKGVRAFNLHRLRALLQIVEALKEAGMDVLSFKGPLLADRYYENPGLRRFTDLDLLVPRTDLRRARDLLKTRGFEAPTEQSDEEIARHIDDQVGLELVRPEDDLRVELHWALLNRSFAFPLTPDGLWSRAEHYNIGPASVRVLSEEDLILYLCAHGTKHHWARLKWLCDVAEVCRRASALDGKRLLDRAVRLDVDRLLVLGLRLAERWLDAPVPAALHARYRDDPVVSELVRHVETEWLLTPGGLDRTPRWEQFRFFLRTRRRWRSRWPLLWEYGTLALTPTEKDRALVDLPSSLSFLYYAIRPFRILGGGGKGRNDATAP